MQSAQDCAAPDQIAGLADLDLHYLHMVLHFYMPDADNSLVSACWTLGSFWRQLLTDRVTPGICTMRFLKASPCLIEVSCCSSSIHYQHLTARNNGVNCPRRVSIVGVNSVGKTQFSSVNCAVFELFKEYF